MWAGTNGTPESINKLPFETGDIFNFFQERPLYFEASQVQKWIEHFGPQLKEWLVGLPRLPLYSALYDICVCKYYTMWDTIDTLLQLLRRYASGEGQKPGDAFEHTAFYAERIAHQSAAPGFLFDVPADKLIEPYDRVHKCCYAAVCLFIVAVVDLRSEGFFSRLVGSTLPEPTEPTILSINNEPAYLDPETGNR